MTNMEIIDLSTAVLSSAVKVAALAEQAVAAARAGDDERALALLDETMAKLDDTTPVVRAQLEALKVAVTARISTKFDPAKVTNP